MKRILLMFCSVFILISLSGCREKTKEEEFNDIQKTFSTINNYSSIGNITVTGNKSSKSFKVKHIFQKPDKYIAEIIEPKDNSGNKTIYNRDTAYMYNNKIDQYTILKQLEIPEEKILFLGYFLRNLSDVEKLKIDREIIAKREYIVISIDVPGNNIYRAYEKLWVDKDTKLPYKLTVYDSKNNEVVKIKYEDVKYNTNIDKEIFNID